MWNKRKEERKGQNRQQFVDQAIGYLQDEGYQNIRVDDPGLRRRVETYYTSGMAANTVPYYLGTYEDKDSLINWGADWGTICSRYFRED
jgi:hypothetical protein